MNEPAKHPVTLRFVDDDLEAQFLHDYIGKSRRPIQVGLLAGLFIYGLLFGVMDWIQATDALTQIWVLRGIVCALGLAAYFYSKSPSIPKYLHEAVALVILLAGVGLMVMILLDHSPDAYLDGPVLLLLPAYVLFRLRFVYASIIGFLLFALYCVVIYFVEGMRATDLIASVIFLFAANMIGMVAGYALENYARKEFWQTLVIDRERKANAELLDVKNRFFANISHEIRTPLTLIVGPLDDLLQENQNVLPSSAVQALHAAKRSGERLLKFLNQLLDLSRVDAQQMPVNYSRGDVVAFLHGEIENFMPYAISKGVSLTLVHSEDSLAFVSDFDKLDVIISNLVSNAIKYTPEGGAVRVMVSRQDEGNAITIEVKDNGPGIPLDAVPYIFDRFYRVPSGPAAKIEGLGLGLSLTKAMVTQLSGNISIETEAGFGSMFSVVLPLLHEELLSIDAPVIDESRAASFKPSPVISDSEEASVTTQEAQYGENKRASLLIVEDDPGVRAYLTRCLGEYAVFEAANGTEGLALATRHIPDLIISDLMMPGMDGRQFVKQIRSSMVLSHIPFIMLTANVSEEAKLENLEEGVDDYLTKPFNKKELLLRVRNMLAARRSLQGVHHAHVMMEPALEEVQSSERVFIERLRTLIDERLSDEHFNVDELADEVGMSVRQLQRKVRALFDETPSTLIRIMRLKKAGQLITAGYGTIAEVAYAVGFNNPAYFTKCFREYFGEAPTNWGVS